MTIAVQYTVNIMKDNIKHIKFY